MLPGGRGRVDGLLGLGGLLVVAAGQNHLGAVLSKRPRCLETEPAVGSGDQGDPARLVTDVVFTPIFLPRRDYPPQ